MQTIKKAILNKEITTPFAHELENRLPRSKVQKELLLWHDVKIEKTTLKVKDEEVAKRLTEAIKEGRFTNPRKFLFDFRIPAQAIKKRLEEEGFESIAIGSRMYYLKMEE